MTKIGDIVKRSALVMSLISFIGIIAIMLLNVADVIMTKALNRSITGTYEITEVLLLCTIMASFAYGQIKKTHICINIFIKPLPGTVKFSILGITGLLSCATAALVGYAAVLQAQSSLSRGAVTSVLMIPMYPFYYVEALAMFVFAAALLYDSALCFAAAFIKRYEDTATSVLY